MSTPATSTRHERKEHEGMAAAVFLAVPFTAIVTGLFNLSDSLSVPGGLLVEPRGEWRSD